MLDLKLLLPDQFDNTFKGHKLSLWFFYLISLITLWRSQHHLFAPDGGAQSIATIPLDAYSSGASSTIVGIFALWGLSQLIVGLIYVLASIRFRSMIPVLYLLAIFEYLVRAAYIGTYKPVETLGDAPGALANIPLIIVFSIMFVLSLWNQNRRRSKKR